MSNKLWQATSEQKEQSNISRFIHFINKTHQKNITSYDELHNYSVTSPREFWLSLTDFFSVNFHNKPTETLIYSPAMKDCRWFDDGTLNYAEHCLSHPEKNTAIISIKENGERQELTFGMLKRQVFSVAATLKSLDIKKGDRVAVIAPNCAESVIIMLAASSIGAVFSSCSPDFGYNGLLERFQQISPKILFYCNGYQYNKKHYQTHDTIQQVVKNIPSLQYHVEIPYLSNPKKVAKDNNTLTWQSFLAVSPKSFEYESCSFNAPLAILYSSGTTGKPKCIVHGIGGTLIQHLKELSLHTNLKENERMFYYTTCGWMMWNWSVSSLLIGASIVLYDGSPMAPNKERLFDLCDQEKVSVFGTSAKYLQAIEKEGLCPMKTHNLSQLQTILSTGSPLSPVSFDYVYQSIKKDLMLSSISGGTDIISCFALGCPIKPVIRGELQCIGLGMDVAIWDENGHELIGEKGELICKSPFPSMPVCFYNDEDGTKYQNSYFAKDKSIWAHGDFAKITKDGGVVILGRSDAVLNPGGVRIGTAEIYRQVEKIEAVMDSVVIGQRFEDDVRIILFVKLRESLNLDEQLIKEIKQMIRKNTTPRHVPKLILQVKDIPKTVSGKTVELAVKNVVEGNKVSNLEAIANPEALAEYTNRAELND